MTNGKDLSKLIFVSAAVVLSAALLTPESSKAENRKLLLRRALVSSAPVGLAPEQTLNFIIACAGNKSRHLPCRVRTRIVDSEGRVRKKFQAVVEIDKMVTFELAYEELLDPLPPNDPPPPTEMPPPIDLPPNDLGEVILRVESLVDTFLRPGKSGGKDDDGEDGPTAFYTTRVLPGFGEVLYLCTPAEKELFKRPVRGDDF